MSIIRIATVFDLDTQDTWSCFISTGIFKDRTFFVGPNQGPILDQFRFRMWTSGSSIQLGWNLDERRCCLRCAGLRQSTLALEGSCSCWSWGGSYTPSKTRKVKTCLVLLNTVGARNPNMFWFRMVERVQFMVPTIQIWNKQNGQKF